MLKLVCVIFGQFLFQHLVTLSPQRRRRRHQWDPHHDLLVFRTHGPAIHFSTFVVRRKNPKFCAAIFYQCLTKILPSPSLPLSLLLAQTLSLSEGVHLCEVWKNEAGRTDGAASTPNLILLVFVPSPHEFANEWFHLFCVFLNFSFVSHFYLSCRSISFITNFRICVSLSNHSLIHSL